MSEIKYGLISKVDSACIEKTIDLICEDFQNEKIYVTEVGIYNGMTSEGISKCIGLVKHKYFHYTGIDNGKDGEQPKHFPNFCSTLIIGNSNEVYNQIPDDSQHLCFVDSCHCFSCVISDFFCYSPKVKRGGYIAFHDTGSHIKPFKDFQHGDKGNPDAYISVRKALTELGLLILDADKQWIGEHGQHFQWATGNKNENWELVFDEADENDPAGGVCVFRKL